MARHDMRGCWTALAVAALWGCSGGAGTAGGPHPVGAESFTSPAPGGGVGSGGAAGGTSAPPTAAPVPAASPAAPSAARAVEEADVYARAGSTLLVLNAWRGLELVDLSDLAAPRVLGRVPVRGTPIDLYLRGTVAFVVVSDAFVWEPVADGGFAPAWRSRLLAVDVADPARPAVLADLALEGSVDQTRLVGDVLYVVSRRYGWRVAAGGGVAPAVPVGAATPAPGEDAERVSSFDVSDPAHPLAVASLDLAATGWDTHAHVTSDRITLSFAGWDGTSAGPVTRFQLVDISDPGGALSAGATLAAAGLVRDRWGMDFDPATGRFRAVLAAGFGNGGARLRLWDWPAAGAAAPLGAVEIPVAEALTAARFDGDRVYLVTARATDPLWVVDASDPAKPVVAGSLQLPGQLDFIEPRGDRLLALGHTSEAGQPFQLQVSLLDVSAPAAPALVGRAIFGAAFGWVNASADDLRKAFIVLDPPPAGPGLLLVPVQGWDPTTWQHQGGTQLLDWSRDALVLRGLAPHRGEVKRAFPVEPSAAHLVAFSDASLQTLDASDRGAPVELARVDLARPVVDLEVVGDHAVELSGDWSTGDMELAITPAADPDAALPLARLDLAAPSARLFQRGTVTWLLARDGASGQGWLQAVDVADPAAPRLRGRLDLSAADAPAFGPWWWGWGDEAVLVGDALAVHRFAWRCIDLCPLAGAGGASGVSPADLLRVFDLSDPDHPALAADVALPENGWSWGLTASGPFAWLSHWTPDVDGGEGRYFLDRVDLSSPAHPVLANAINIPGVFLGASPDGRRVQTLETRYDGQRGVSWVHALALTGRGTARLTGSVRVDGWPYGALSSGDRVYLTAQDLTSSGSPAGTRLLALDMAAVRVTSTQPVSGWAWARQVAGGKLFLEGSWPDQGLLAYDLADPGRPAFQQLIATRGWVQDIVVAGGQAYLPSGPYGVQVVPLTAPR